jgi:hypothetical protein
MADKQRERRAKTNIDAFLQHASIGQRRDYLVRGRRFGTLDGGQLRESWIFAVRNWLARKDRAAELTMDDLTAELRLRGLEPPYDAVKQELAVPLALEGSVRSRKRKLEENSRDKSACSGVRTTSRFTRPGGGKFNKLPGARAAAHKSARMAAATLSASFDTRGRKRARCERLND